MTPKRKKVRHRHQYFYKPDMGFMIPYGEYVCKCGKSKPTPNHSKGKELKK